MFVFLHLKEYGAKNDGYYVRPSITGTLSSIARWKFEANSFKIKPNVNQMVQQMVQFDVLPHEDPNAHITNFLEWCDTFRMDGVTDNAIRLSLFQFTLSDKENRS